MKLLKRVCRARSYSSGHLSWVSCSCLPWKPATGSIPIGGLAAPPQHPPPTPVQRMQAHAMLSKNRQLMLLLLLLLLLQLLLLLVSRCMLSVMCHKQSATSTQAISINCMHTSHGCMHRYYGAHLLHGIAPISYIKMIALPAVVQLASSRYGKLKR